MRKVVVTGLGAVSPCGPTMSSTWDALLRGRAGIGPVEGFDVSDLRCKVAGQARSFSAERYLEPKTIRHTGRFTHMAVAAAQMAVDAAGFSASAYGAQRAGTLIGTGIADLARVVEAHVVMTEEGARRVPPYFVSSAITNTAAGHLAMRFGLQGPSFATASACSSGAHALGVSLDLIRSGRVDAMLAGGAEANVTRVALGGFDAMRAMSSSGACKPFHRARDGFVLAEGAAILVLEEYEAAKRRGAPILCELAGYGATTDAHHPWHPAPVGRGLSAAISLAIDDAKIARDRVSYVNAHATATAAGDLCEAQALARSFGPHAERGLWVSSTKSMHGHLLGAAGALEAAITVMALKEGVAPATHNLDEVDPEIRLDLVRGDPRERAMDVVMSNSTGFGGHNASLIFARAP